MKKKIAQKLRKIADTLPLCVVERRTNMTGEELMAKGIFILNEGTEKEIIVHKSSYVSKEVKWMGRVIRNEQVEVPMWYRNIPIQVPVDHYDELKKCYEKGGQDAVEKYCIKARSYHRAQTKVTQATVVV